MVNKAFLLLLLFIGCVQVTAVLCEAESQVSAVRSVNTQQFHLKCATVCRKEPTQMFSITLYGL